MSFDEENLAFLHKRLIHGKDKCEVFLKQREFHLDIKPQKHNQMDMLLNRDASAEPTPAYNVISNDVWYQVSKFIQPECVQTFALICTQTAALVRRKSFWKHLYLKYCQKDEHNTWLLKLPAHLQLDNIRNYNASVFRTCVIEALFLSYAPLMKRSESYYLDMLVGRTFVSAWHKPYDECMWVTCYQLKLNSLQQNALNKCSRQKRQPFTNKSNDEVVNNWELLAAVSEKNINYDSDTEEDEEKDESCFFVQSKESAYDGVCLLLIFCRRFIPFPAELTYEANKIRLAAIRRPLTSDMREYSLELDFVNAINKEITSIKYPTAKHLVLPWWHPEFRKCKFEAHDKFT